MHFTPSENWRHPPVPYLNCTCTVPVWQQAQRLACRPPPPPPLPPGPPPSSCMPCWSRTRHPRMQCAPGAWRRPRPPLGWCCRDPGTLWGRRERGDRRSDRCWNIDASDSRSLCSKIIPQFQNIDTFSGLESRGVTHVFRRKKVLKWPTKYWDQQDLLFLTALGFVQIIYIWFL